MGMSDLLATRRHAVLDARADQIEINLSAYHGGSEYIASRLSRFPSESDTDWSGDAKTGTGTAVALGRLQRAFLINYCRRIAQKTNQYVFQKPVVRDGADQRFLSDATSTGMSLNQFMAEVSSLLTVARWCWIGIDRPPAPEGRSVAQREAAGDRVYWQLYAPNEVVDWSFDASGGLRWLLTESSEYRNDDPTVEAKTNRIRYLWRPGMVTKMVYNDQADGFSEKLDIPIGINRVPFVLCGLISPAPWWFDDIERIQRAIMDMYSSRDTQIFKAVFALLVVSKSFSEQVRLDGITQAEARRKIGIGNPLVETADEKSLTRYLDAPAAVFQVIKDAVQDLKAEAYEIVGLNMSVPESRQVASAEAKAWDHMDPEAVLAERATVLEEAETKAVEISAALGGPVFKAYRPVYSKSFDITDFAADIQAITQTGGFSLPPLSEKLIQKALVGSIGKRFNVPAVDLQKALAEIDTFDASVSLGIGAAG